MGCEKRWDERGVGDGGRIIDGAERCESKSRKRRVKLDAGRFRISTMCIWMSLESIE